MSLCDVKSHLQMSFISVGTGFSLVSLGIMAKPATAYRHPSMVIRLSELRSWGNSKNSDHLSTTNTHIHIMVKEHIRYTKLYSVLSKGVRWLSG